MLRARCLPGGSFGPWRIKGPSSTQLDRGIKVCHYSRSRDRFSDFGQAIEDFVVASTTRIALLLKRVSWLAGLAILCVLGYALLEVVPAWHRYFQGASAHELRRHAAIAFLDAFLITYLILPCMALGVPLYLILGRVWRTLPRPSPRLLLLSGSLFVCVLILETAPRPGKSGCTAILGCRRNSRRQSQTRRAATSPLAFRLTPHRGCQIDSLAGLLNPPRRSNSW